MKIPITQSREWHKLQQDLGEKSFLVEEKDYQYLAIVKKAMKGNYLYCPYGPVYDSRESFKQSLNSLEALAKQNAAYFIRIESQDSQFKSYAPKNAVKSHDLNPKETWLLDLTGDDEQLKAKLPSRLLRYYRKSIEKGITIEESHDPNDIKYLLGLQKSLADKKGISTFSEHYLQTELKQPFATLYLVRYNDGSNSQIVAAGLVFDSKDTRYNLQGAQSEQGRALHATGILTIKLILDAKAKSLKIFDFWGIAPDGAPSDHPWAGFTNFKKTFAGHEQEYAGTYDIVLDPKKYKAYQFLRKVNRIIRKIK